MENNPFRPFAARIISVIPESDVEFTLKVAAQADICPGQFFQISLPKVGEAPISVSSFSDDSIDFTIRAVGRLTNVVTSLTAGQTLFIRGPYGHGFPLATFHNRDLLIVAGGSGVAPVKPLIEKAITGELGNRSLKLIIGFKNSSSILFTDQIKNWSKKAEVVLTIDKPEEGWNGSTGLVTEHIKKIDAKAIDNLHAVVVGPTMMMKFSSAELVLLGMAKESIWVSFERHMSCGIGKCGHCKIDNTYACVDGPVLNYADAVKLID
jgi:anaerobic sulfite reductase subunit B